MKIRLLLALLVFVLHVQAYNIRHITNVDGLSSSSVLTIEQQSDGAMLFGTIDGLNSYDGHRVWPTTFNAGQRLYGNLIEHVVTVEGDKTWVLTNYGLNIVSAKGQTVRFYPEYQGLRRIRRNPQGDGFLLQDGKLNYIGRRDGRIHVLPLHGVTLGDICDFAFSHNELLLFRHEGVISYPLQLEDSVYSIGRPTWVKHIRLMTAVNNDGVEYMVSDDGQLYSYDIKSRKMQHEMLLAAELSRRGGVTDVLRFKESLMIAFTEGGVIKVNRHAGKPDEIVDLDVETGVFCLRKDRLGDIVWIGSDGRGVLMYCDEPLTLRSFPSASIRAGKSCPIRTLLKDDDGNLWVGTKGDGVICLPKFSVYQNPRQLKEMFFREQNSGLTSNVIYHFAESKFPGFWISGGEGICYYSYDSKKILPVQADRRIQQVIDVREKDNQLWMAALGTGIFRADIIMENGLPRLTNMRQYSLDDGKGPSNYFFCLTYDQRGRWWFGNRGMGLYTLENDQLRHIPTLKTQDPSINDVFAMQAVGDNLWIGTGMGICILDKNRKSRRLSTTDGLPNNTIHAFTKGKDGEVWATTNSGLVELSSNGTVLKVYGMNSGLDVTEYSDGAAFAKGMELFFGGINGFTAIENGKTTNQKIHESQIGFTALDILGKLQNINEFTKGERDNLTLTLNHTQNTFSVSLATFNYLEEPFYHYLYRLTDNGEWIDNGASNIISFTQMAEGSHTLYVKAKNMHDGSETVVSQLHIDIPPPYYRTIWAYLVYAMLALAVIVILARNWYKDQKLQQQMQLAKLNQQHQDELYEEKLKFLTNVVHELNTPLTLIYGPCERILAYGKTDGFVRKYVGKVMQNLSRLNSLIQEIIDLRRVTSGHHVISWRRVDVSSVISDFASAFTEMAERSGITYQQEIEPGVVWTSDDTALKRIASNLISNAFKYTKSEGTVKVTLARQNDGLLFSVYNSGRGITPEDRQRIFDYYTVFDSVDESPNAGQTSRNGLGMAICHNMVKMLGGSIDIDSKVGEYAQFNVFLPNRPLPEGVSDEIMTSGKDSADAAPTEPLSATSSAQPSHPLPKMAGDKTPTILAIDDNQEMLELLSDSLSGYRVLTAVDAEQGLAYLKEETPDLIITDIMMPGTDGLDFTQQVKKNRHTMHIPLIILSAKASEEERIEGLESGADVYISKPFSINLLQATVVRLLENRDVLREYYNSSASAYVYSSGILISKEHQNFADEVIRVIDEHLTDCDLTPEVLADLMSISPRNLYRKFSDANLPTPKDYIKTYRINMAARWLTTTNATIQEIIYKTGFNTRSQFYSEFRKHFGMTPKEYREHQQIKDDRL